MSSARKTLLAKFLHELGSLRSALILSVLVGVGVPASIATYDDRTRLTEQFNESLQADLTSTGGLLALAMREPLWQFAIDQAESIIEAAFVDTRILAIEVLDNEGRPFASRRRENFAEEGGAVFTETVKRGTQKLGTLVVTLSDASYRRQLQMALENDIRRGIQTLLGSLLLIVLLLRFRLVRPINRLVAASASLADGDLARPIESERGDELGQLARSMESTRQALARLFAELEQRNAELRESNDELEARVLARTHELQEALATLRRAQADAVESEKLASLGRVVAGVAHELNTPIGNALTVASTLGERLSPMIAEARAGNLRRSTLDAVIDQGEQGIALLLRNLEKAAEMIQNFKQVAVDQTSEQRRPFNLKQVTDEVLSTLKPALRKTSHSLETDLAPDIQCDSFPGPYGQVITNLVMNALTHAFENQEKGKITIRAKAFGDARVQVTVEDNGAGMTDEVRRRIFDPFFTTRMGRGGSGLGMNIVQGFVNKVLGGRISVESEPGKGSRMTMEFPLTAPQHT